MGDGRAGHHGDIVYKFEDAGFDTTPTDDEYKLWGGNATLDTYDGSHNAVRVFNAEETAAEIIEQTFTGSWSITCDLTQPPWWIAGVFGQPGSGSLISGSLYEYTYNTTDSNNPVSLRLYAPTDGFTNYKMIPGAVIASMSIDQSADGSPELSVNGAYAREPVTQSSPSVTVPNFEEDTMLSRDAAISVGGTTVGKAQNASISLEPNVELISEIGSESQVDFIPQQFNASSTVSHIIWSSQSVDFLQEFKDGTIANTELLYDNGGSGDSTYIVEFETTNALRNQWTESGRNDPGTTLQEEINGMAEAATARIQTTVTDDDTAGEVPGTA